MLQETMFLVFFYFSQIFYVQTQKIVSINYRNDHLNRSNFEINFVQENKKLRTGFNTYVQYPLFKTSLKLESQIIENKTLLLNNPYQCSLYNLDVEIQDTIIEKMNFYITEEVGNNRADMADNGIGLAYKFENESYSFIHKLYNNHLIEYLQFTYEYYDHLRNGTIHFGGIPNNKYKSLPYQGYANIAKDSKSWKMKLTGVGFEGQRYEFNKDAVIHNAFYDIFWSNELNNLMLKIFEKEIEEGFCINREYYEYSFVQCDNDTRPIFDKKIKFQFKELTITLKIRDLFRISSGEWQSIINANPYELYDNSVIIGVRFLNLFNYSVFDYENQQVRFYSDKTIIEMDEFISMDYSTPVRCLCILIILMMIGNFIYLGYLVKRKQINE